MNARSIHDEGYFPRSSSILRRVHEQRAVGLLYGQRALGIGALNPRNFIGTRNHTWARATPFRRLAHTAKLFETVFFASRAEADKVLEFVHRAHQPVHGELADDAGAYDAGTTYSAYDPELMLWTVAVMYDSARTFYELLVRALTAEERDRFWAEYVDFGALFGMPRDVAPGSHAAFEVWYRERLVPPKAHLTEEARYVGSAVMFEIPVPVWRRPAMHLHNLVMLGSLPEPVRAIYGLRWTSAHAAAFHSAVAGLRTARPVTPHKVRAGENTVFFELVDRAERKRIERGRPVAGATP